MNYIRVENNEIIGNPRELPFSFNNISNFNLLDVETLKLHGWFPYRIVTAHITNDVMLDKSDVIVEENEVVEYQRTRQKTENEINAEINSMWINVRRNRNIELSNSDWTQLPDSPLTEEKKQEWVVYRQSLRDITLQPNPFNLIWPTKPE